MMTKHHWIPLVLCLLLASVAHADDTDVYLHPPVASSAEPLVVFTLDYRPNLGSTVCQNDQCDQLIEEGYLPRYGPYTFLDLLRAVLEKVLTPLGGLQVAVMLNHNNTCTGSQTSGPDVTGCSNGAYVLYGFRPLSAGASDPNKQLLFQKLAALPVPQGNLSHPFQGKELYFELFRYLTGQGIYNGHLGYEDFGNTDPSTNLDTYFPSLSWDPSAEDSTHTKYISPLNSESECTRAYAVNFMFQVSQQEDDSDAAILASKADGGMAGINLSGRNNNFTTVIQYMNDVNLADGTFGTVPALDGNHNLVSYFIVDPTKINQTTNGYALAGGTGGALALSTDPQTLINELNSILQTVLSVSATFVAPSVPVNVFNRSQVVDEVFMALFQADPNGLPLWPGNLKKLVLGTNPITGQQELQDVYGNSAIDIDGRIKRDALTFWTKSSALPPPTSSEVAGADGRAVARGGAGQKIPGFISGNPGVSNSSTGARQLFTEDPSNSTTGLMPLNADSTTEAALWSDITAKWSPAASSSTYAGATSAEQQKGLDALLFARGLEDDGVTTRPWLMGDPLHSRPEPINYGARAGYTASHPDIRILVGTNDGVMHMFRDVTSTGAQDGSEVWGFVPRAAVPMLTRLHDDQGAIPVHPSTVDGTPSVLTIDVNSDGTINSADGDKAYAYFGLRRGGKSIYALDVSNPDSPHLMWRIDKSAPGGDFAALGQTWSTPQVGYVEVGSSTVPVVIFGGGYHGDDNGDNIGDLGKDAANRATDAGTTPAVGTDDTEGNAIYIVNALDGSLIWKAVEGSTQGYDSVKKAYTRPDMTDSIPADVVTLDTNGDGLIDRIYAGDTGGNVWRVDLAGMYAPNSTSTPQLVYNQPSVWKVTKLLSVGRHVSGFDNRANDRRFFNPPDVAQTRDNTGPYDAVIIGSGDRTDPNSTDVTNYLYMVKDRAITSGLPSSTTLVQSDLADLTSNCLQNNNCTTTPSLTNGWRIELTNAGEKNLAPALTSDGKIFFTTFAPTPTDSGCSLSEGTGRLYVVSLQDATAVMDFDTANDSSGVTLERAETLASGGIPVQVVPLSGSDVLVQGEPAGKNIINTGNLSGFRTYWHELDQ